MKECKNYLFLKTEISFYMAVLIWIYLYSLHVWRIYVSQINIKFDKNQPNFHFNLSYLQSLEHFLSR